MGATLRARNLFCPLGKSAACALTPGSPFVCIGAVKPFLCLGLLVLSTACTTLENRRDLYRAPEEGYEKWSRHAPPTRLPNSMPGNTSTTTTTTTTTRNGVITYPDE